MALQVVSPAVSVTKVLGVDSNGAEKTEEQTFKRGEVLPKWVSPYQQFVLMTTGMAKQIGDYPDPALVADEDRPAPVMLPEHAPSAVEGSGFVPPVPATEAEVKADASASDDTLPADSANKVEWEDYAVNHLNWSRGDAEAMRKADLVAAVKDAAAKK